MPELERPDGTEIHWEEEGSGPPVLIVHQLLWSYPQVYVDLIADLARDHRVITYAPRGCGSSSRRGPYDSNTDTDDLLALAEAAGGHAVALAVGYGYNVAVRVAARRPDLISALLSVQPAAAAMLPRSELRESGVLAASDSVVEMLLQMMTSEPRAALRAVLTATNPELTDDELKERLDRASAYISPEAAHDRAEAWLADDPSEPARTVGDRLWILHSEAEPLFEGTLAARVAELYPSAHVEQIPGGPISNPQLVAERIRRLTGASPR
jgi:pimeloyl-ACP methyl ester carboxylesterase